MSRTYHKIELSIDEAKQFVKRFKEIVDNAEKENKDTSWISPLSLELFSNITFIIKKRNDYENN